MELGVLWRILKRMTWGMVFVLVPFTCTLFKSGWTVTFQDITVLGFIILVLMLFATIVAIDAGPATGEK
jgi:hypothetical protein